MPVEDECAEPQMSLIAKRLCALSWRTRGKRRGTSSACGCGLENCPLLITASVPCDSFHSDQFNKLTDTNFHYCQQGAANTRAKDQAACRLRFLYQQRGRQLACVSGLLGAGMDCWWGKGHRLIFVHQAEVAGWTTWNILFWFVKRASREGDPLEE